MDVQIDIAKVKELLDKAQEILLVTHERPTFDSVGSSLALALGLVGLGKKVTVACPDPMTVELSSFIGVNKVTADLTKKNFIISLDYVDGSIEKVSYNIEGNKFNLVIEPRAGFEPYTADKAHYSYTGTNADLIIAVDTIHLGGLKHLYEDNKELFATKSVVNIDYHPNNSNYGTVNLIDTRASSTAELVAELLAAIDVAITADIATNILNALYAATGNFQESNVTASAFEVAAASVKAGGKRFTKDMAARPPKVQVAENIASASAGGSVSGSTPPTGQALPSSGQAPADWLKPKIFKSSNPLH